MCNYGLSGPVSPAEMVGFVREGLASINRPITELYVSPSGSLLDELEVPAEARRSILRMVNGFPSERFSFETRPITVTQSVIDELHELVPSKQIAIGFGLESANPWVLRNCINKTGANDEFASAAGRLLDIDLYANVSLGSAFLSPAEAVEDTVRSAEWALEHGADIVLVFPMHVKRYTLLEWLYQHGLYEPPSLWSLIEVLQRLESSCIPRVSISWYRSDYGADPNIVASPATCPQCEEDVTATLDEFRANSSLGAVNRLRELECECRKAWGEQLKMPADPLTERVFGVYRLIAKEIGLTDWWEENASALAAEMSVE